MCVLFTVKLFVNIFLLQEKLTEMCSKMYFSLQVTYLLFLSVFHESLIFSTVFRKILEYKISWKSVLWEQHAFLADWQTGGKTERQTDRHDEANSWFSQFCEDTSSAFLPTERIYVLLWFSEKKKRIFSCTPFIFIA